mgnify:CR=1 FL=1
MTVTLSGTPVLETERLILRAPVPQDLPTFAAFAVSERSVFVRSQALDEGQVWRAFGHIIGHWVLRGFGQFVFADRTTGEALGMAGPWFPAGWPEREIGWTVWAPGAEGKGLAFEAATAARAHAFRDLGWRTAVSYIAPKYSRSIALARRLGAVQDDSAAAPGTDPCLVFRHPGPGEAP